MTVPAVFPSIPAGTGHLPSPHAGFFRAGEAIFRPLSIKNNAGPGRTRPSKSSPPSSSVSLPLFQILPGAANGPFHFPELEKENHAEQIQLLRQAVDDTHPSRPPQRPSPPKGITPPILLPVNAVYDFLLSSISASSSSRERKTGARPSSNSPHSSNPASLLFSTGFSFPAPFFKGRRRPHVGKPERAVDSANIFKRKPVII